MGQESLRVGGGSELRLGGWAVMRFSFGGRGDIVTACTPMGAYSRVVCKRIFLD